MAGPLTIGAFATAARGLAPGALGRLARAHPALRVTVHEMEPHDALAALVRGVVDLAVAQDWANAPLAVPEGLLRAPLLDDVADVARPKDGTQVRHTAAEYATQLAFVEAGLGAAVLPRLGRGPLPAGVRVVEVTPALHRHVYALWRADASRRTAIQPAVEALGAVAGELGREVRPAAGADRGPARREGPARMRRTRRLPSTVVTNRRKGHTE